MAGSSNAGAFSDEQLDKLADIQLNGRQIKNLIKTASLLAWSKEESVKFDHVQAVLKLREISSQKVQ